MRAKANKSGERRQVPGSRKVTGSSLPVVSEEMEELYWANENGDAKGSRGFRHDVNAIRARLQRMGSF